jgi:hypothetical protein
MNSNYVPVEEVAKRATDGFFQNVRKEIIPRFIVKGVLQGKTEGKEQLVADDEALARLLRLGVESFVYNQQGYSFLVVRAPIEQVAAKLKARPRVAQYEENVPVGKMRDGVGVEPNETVRHTFLVQLRETPEWTVLIQTVHWFFSCDSVMGTALACALSKELQTLAAAAWDDDFSGSSLVICENGIEKQTVSDEEDGWEGFYEFFYEHGIYLPELFISVADGNAALYVGDPAEIQRADYVVLKVPQPIESKGPHVFEKLGMMAEAMSEELDDEEAFMQHMRSGIWDQAQALLNSGEI